MIWTPLNIGLAGTSDGKPRFLMDEDGLPSCAMAKGGDTLFYRHNGTGWEYLGDNAIVARGEAYLPKNCIAYGNDGFPNIIFFPLPSAGGVSLVHTFWDGDSWTSTGTGVVLSGDILGAAITNRRGTLWVAAITRPSSSSLSREVSLHTYGLSGWAEVARATSLSGEDSPPWSDVSVRQVAREMYVLWQAGMTPMRWIGHAAYNVDSSSWTNIPLNRVAVTVTDGDLGEFDFVPTVEAYGSSSSSSSSSSINSSSSSLNSSSSSSSISSVSSPSTSGSSASSQSSASTVSASSSSSPSSSPSTASSQSVSSMSTSGSSRSTSSWSSAPFHASSSSISPSSVSSASSMSTLSSLSTSSRVGCNGCSPGLKDTYTVTFSGLGGTLAAFNGIPYVVPYSASTCLWELFVGPYRVILYWSAGWYATVENTPIPTCWARFAYAGAVDPCVLMGPYSLDSCGDASCPGTCAASGSATAFVS